MSDVIGIKLTAAAAGRMLDYMGEDAAGIRISLEKAGCSGLMYRVAVASEVTDVDEVFDSDGVKIVVSRADLPFLLGSCIDFRKSGLSSAFHFDNPNAVAQCGCGESFTVTASAEMENKNQ